MIKKLSNKMIEIELKSSVEIKNPFWSVELKAVFSHESTSEEQTVNGFYDGTDSDGNHCFRIRWMPSLPGIWNCNIDVYPKIDGLEKEIRIEVKKEEVNTRGFLRAIPGRKWGLWFDNDEPFYLLGDTIYNLFGGAYCGSDVESVLRYRKEQGVNYVRAKMQVSSYMPGIRSSWQTKDCWAWGGSAQSPDFTRFNLEYFRAVDEVMSIAAELNIGLELILEAWLVEFPFNDRARFLPEYEQLWLKYIIARFAAYPSVYVWCPANEYEFYPDGITKYHPEADHWMKRISTMIKGFDPYQHPVGVHNWEQKNPLCERVGNGKDIDIYLVQSDWCYELEKYDWKRDGSLCMCIEDQVMHHAPERDKVIICDEFGYEKAEGCFTYPAHDLLDHHHTRRGQWRAAFSGFPIVHGFNNTWGPHIRIDKDAIGAQYLIRLYRFMTEDVKFYEISPAPELIISSSGNQAEGTLPLCLAKEGSELLAVYFPTQGECKLLIPQGKIFNSVWINPRTGARSKAEPCHTDRFVSPETKEGNEEYGDDWILLLTPGTKE